MNDKFLDETYAAVKRQEQEAKRELKALRDEAHRRGFGSLSHLLDEITGGGYEEAAVEHWGKKAMVELRDFLSALPGLYKLKSGEEYVLGYVPLGGAVSNQEEQELGEWNALQRRALSVSVRMGKWITEGGIGDEELGVKVPSLLAAAAHFVAERHQLALLLLESRQGRLGTKVEDLPFSLTAEEIEAGQRLASLKREIGETEGVEALRAFEQEGEEGLERFRRGQETPAI